MDIERVAPGRALGPPRVGERLAPDHDPEAVRERTGEAGFHGRQHEQAISIAEHTGRIHRWLDRLVAGDPGAERAGPAGELLLLDGQDHPVLEAVARLGRLRAGIEQEQAGTSLLGEHGAAVRVVGPPDEGDVHSADRTAALLPGCFVPVNARAPHEQDACPYTNGITGD